MYGINNIFSITDKVKSSWFKKIRMETVFTKKASIHAEMTSNIMAGS